MGKPRIIDKTQAGTGKLSQTGTKYCIARPRLRNKTFCDLHRRPVSSRIDVAISQDCCPSPVVVSPVCYPQITSVEAFEQEFGQLLRRTPEYHGMRRHILGTVLSQRTAIHLSSLKWVPDPVLVSDKVLRSWLDQYEIPAGSDTKFMYTAQLRKSMETFLDLEMWYGPDLRKYVSLGFTGRRALEEYLGRHGVSVRERVVRAWYDKCRLYTPEELSDIYEEDTGRYVARPMVVEVTR